MQQRDFRWLLKFYDTLNRIVVIYFCEIDENSGYP